VPYESSPILAEGSNETVVFSDNSRTDSKWPISAYLFSEKENPQAMYVAGLACIL